MTAKILSMPDRRARPNAAEADPSSPEGTDFSPVTIFSSYLVSSGNIDRWTDTWRELANTAATWPGCRSFRLVRDRYDPMYVAVVSEWDDDSAYRAFTQGTRRMWQPGAIGFDVVPGESRVLTVLSEPETLQAAR